MRNQGTDMRLYRKYVAQMSQIYNQREDVRMFVELLLTLSAIFVFSVFAIRPTLKTIGGLQQEIEVKRDTIQTMDRKIENIQLAQQTYAEASGTLPLLLQAVPGTADAATLIRELELIAQEQGVTIQQITLQSFDLKSEVPQTGLEQSVGYTLTISGSFSNLNQTLKQIENMRRGSLFMSRLISLSDSGDGGILMTIVGTVPYFVSTN